MGWSEKVYFPDFKEMHQNTEFWLFVKTIGSEGFLSPKEVLPKILQLKPIFIADSGFG